MAIATGTATAIATGVAALSAGGATALQARAANRSTDAQERATREAMQYQREREWRERTAQRSQQQAYYDWYQRVYGGGAGASGAPPAKIEAPGSGAFTHTSAPVGAGPGGVVAPTTTVPPIAGAPPPVTGAPVIPPVTGAPVPPVPTEPIRTMADLMPQGWSSHQRFMR